LSFSNHLHRFDSGNHPTRGSCGSRTLHRAQASFDMTEVGFDAVIRVPLRSMSTAVAELTFVLQFSNSRRRTAQSVSGENVWYSVVGIS
jgi:hypothetical protein